jgi:hypothetical protein
VNYALRSRLGSLASCLLNRLVGVARQTGIHLAELRQLGNIGFISHSDVLRLDLDYLLERLRTAQLLGGASAVLERLFRVVGHLSGRQWPGGPYSPQKSHAVCFALPPAPRGQKMTSEEPGT